MSREDKREKIRDPGRLPRGGDEFISWQGIIHGNNSGLMRAGLCIGACYSTNRQRGREKR